MNNIKTTVISVDKNNPPTTPFKFEIRPYRYVDEDGMGSDRRALSIICQEKGHIKFILKYDDEVWNFSIYSFPTQETFGEMIFESPEQLKNELVKFSFSTEDNVEERYQSIMEYLSENETELKLVTGRTGIKKSLYGWAEFVNNKLHIISDRENNLYAYKGGLYRIDRNWDDVRNLYRDTALELYNPGSVGGIVGQIKTIKRTEDEDFNPDRNIVNFPNGLLNLKSGLLSAHTPTYVSTIQLPHPYVPNGKSKRIDSILGEILQPEDIVPLKEFVGYAMTPKINFKRAMIFVGDRGAGKNTVQDIINTCVGHNNIEAFKLQDLSNRFNLYSLKNKLLNSADELSTKKLTDNSTFKMMTSGSDWLQMEGKHKQAARFRQTTKLLFSTNKVPESADHEDGAYYIRWSIITFLQHFDTEDEQTRTDILDSLTDDDYANFGSECVELFMEVMKRDKFTGDVEEEQKILEYRLKSNHMKEFLKILEPEAGEHITKVNMHSHIYFKWCEEVGIPDATRHEYSQFWKIFKKESAWKHGLKGSRGDQVSVIREVKVSEEWGQRIGVTA